MKGITKYVLWQLLVGMILVTAGLTCVIWLSQSLRFVEMIVNRGLSVGTFIYLTMLLLPNFLSIIMPIALFTVVVFTYNKLIADRELVVMRSAGLSQNALAKPALILAFAVVFVGYSLTLYLLPNSYRMFREMQWDIRYNYSQILLREGAFNVISDDVTVYLRKRTNDGQLRGILVHDVRKKDKPSTIMAERGAVIDSDGYARVVMFDGNRQEIDKNTKNLSILYFDKYVFDLESKKNDGGIRYREARERMPLELLNIKKEKLMNKKDHGKFIVEGHNRFISPLSALAFTLGRVGLHDFGKHHSARPDAPHRCGGRNRRPIASRRDGPAKSVCPGIALGSTDVRERNSAHTDRLLVHAASPTYAPVRHRHPFGRGVLGQEDRRASFFHPVALHWPPIPGELRGYIHGFHGAHPCIRPHRTDAPRLDPSRSAFRDAHGNGDTQAASHGPADVSVRSVVWGDDGILAVDPI